jgi:uncharacterized integral membrane protein (TIGR00698 family)
VRERLPGLLLTALIALPAWLIGKAVPVVGAPVLGILLGMLLTLWRRPASFETGIRYTSKKVLQYAIIFLGFEMNLFNVLKTGQQTLLLMAFTFTATFLTAYVAGRALKVDSQATTLIGVGTAICGGSAIAATAPVIGASDEDVAHAISTIFLFNVIAAFLFPALGHTFGMSDATFGVWAGTAVNDTSSVVAAAYSYSDAAGNLAVIVKLTRTLMIVPISLALALWASRKAAASGAVAEPRHAYSLARVFPWFVLGFAAAALVNTLVTLPVGLGPLLGQAGKFMIVMAMAAIGLNTHLGRLVRSGGRPILLGLVCWAVLAVTSLGVQGLIL